LRRFFFAPRKDAEPEAGRNYLQKEDTAAAGAIKWKNIRGNE
jgi:hypothetical protein